MLAQCLSELVASASTVSQLAQCISQHSVSASTMPQRARCLSQHSVSASTVPQLPVILSVCSRFSLLVTEHWEKLRILQCSMHPLVRWLGDCHRDDIRRMVHCRTPPPLARDSLRQVNHTRTALLSSRSQQPSRPLPSQSAVLGHLLSAVSQPAQCLS